MPLDIREDHLLLVKNILKEQIPRRAVWAFGSRVKGAATKTSDLDLCIMGDDPLSFECLAHLRDAFSESNLPYKVDVIDWATLKPAFRAIIAAEKWVI